MASERVAAAILLRVGRSGPPASALVRAAAVLGESGDGATAAALAGLDRAAAAELADALARAQIFEPGPSSGPLRFVHPLVRSAVYEDMPRSERARLHAHAARLLAAARGGADAAAAHLLHTEPAGDERDRRVAALEPRARHCRAGRRRPRRSSCAAPSASRRPMPSGPALLVELGAAAAWAGQDDGVELLREGFRSTVEQPDRALAGIELAFALGVSSGGSAEAIGVLVDVARGSARRRSCARSSTPGWRRSRSTCRRCGRCSPSCCCQARAAIDRPAVGRRAGAARCGRRRPRPDGSTGRGSRARRRASAGRRQAHAPGHRERDGLRRDGRDRARCTRRAAQRAAPRRRRARAGACARVARSRWHGSRSCARSPA